MSPEIALGGSGAGQLRAGWRRLCSAGSPMQNASMQLDQLSDHDTQPICRRSSQGQADYGNEIIIQSQTFAMRWRGREIKICFVKEEFALVLHIRDVPQKFDA